MHPHTGSPALTVAAITSAHAGPELPQPFHGYWCGETADNLRPCSDGGGAVVVEVDGTSITSSTVGCVLDRLKLTKITRREIEYAATYTCGEHIRFFAPGFEPTRSYRIGVAADAMYLRRH